MILKLILNLIAMNKLKPRTDSVPGTSYLSFPGAGEGGYSHIWAI